MFQGIVKLILRHRVFVKARGRVSSRGTPITTEYCKLAFPLTHANCDHRADKKALRSTRSLGTIHVKMFINFRPLLEFTKNYLLKVGTFIRCPSFSNQRDPF